jgi:hypothetical protein
VRRLHLGGIRTSCHGRNELNFGIKAQRRALVLTVKLVVASSIRTGRRLGRAELANTILPVEFDHARQRDGSVTHNGKIEEGTTVERRGRMINYVSKILPYG